MSEQDRPGPAFDAALLETLASSIGACVTIYDRNDVLLFASPDVYRFYPVSAGIFAPGARLRDALGALYDAGLQSGRVFFSETTHISREDWIAERIALHWRERYESVEQLPDGRWVRMGKRRLPSGILVSFVIDISEQKRRDRELVAKRDQAELSQHVLDNLANPVLVKDSELRFVIINDAFCRLLGFHAKNIIGRTASELVGESAAAIFEETERAVLHTGVPVEFVEDITHADGKIIRAITRKRRSGTPGNHYVTVSVDYITTVSAALDAQESAVTTAASRPVRHTRRILVADEDRERGTALVNAMAVQGIDAVAICEAHEVFAFLDTARTMGLTIDSVEASAAMATALRADAACAAYPELAGFHAGPSPEESRHVTDHQELRPATPSAVTGRRIKVLVAEDNEVNQIVFEQILEGLEVEFRIVGDGAEALSAWRDFEPDIVLMDVSMPVMNGLEAAQAIRQAEGDAGAGAGTAHVPIVAVTAHAMSGDSDRCFAAGMDDYLTKPVSPEKLETAIRNWIDDSLLSIAAA